jgi:hypothetical protein
LLIGSGWLDVTTTFQVTPSDYYQAEHILESHQSQKFSLLGSFAVSAIAFVLGRSAEENYANAIDAVIGLNELADEYEHRGTS